MRHPVQEKLDIDDGVQRKKRAFNQRLSASLEIRELIPLIIRKARRLIAERPSEVFKDSGLARASTTDDGVILGIKVEDDRTKEFTIGHLKVREPDCRKPRLCGGDSGMSRQTRLPKCLRCWLCPLHPGGGRAEFFEILAPAIRRLKHAYCFISPIFISAGRPSHEVG
jgi:hypothetical protein